MKKIILLIPLMYCTKSFAMWPVIDVGAVTQLISATANQAVMINNQYQMLKSIAKGDIHVSDFTGTVNKLKNISDSGMAVSYATKNLDSKFNMVFGEEGTGAEQQANQSQSMLDSALNTLKTASTQLAYVQQQANAVSSITNASNSASGALSVAQGTNQLINSTNSQLQSMTAMQAQANSLLATTVAEKAAADKAVAKQKLISFAFSDTYVPYEDNPDFANIPDFT